MCKNFNNFLDYYLESLFWPLVMLVALLFSKNDCFEIFDNCSTTFNNKKKYTKNLIKAFFSIV